MIISTNYHYKARRNSAISFPCQYPDYKQLVLIENVLCDTFMARNSLPCWDIDIGKPSFSWTTPIPHPLVGSITKKQMRVHQQSDCSGNARLNFVVTIPVFSRLKFKINYCRTRRCGRINHSKKGKTGFTRSFLSHGYIERDDCSHDLYQTRFEGSYHPIVKGLDLTVKFINKITRGSFFVLQIQ